MRMYWDLNRRLSVKIFLIVVLGIIVSNISHAMNIGKYKEVEVDAYHPKNRDQNIKHDDKKLNERRNLDVIDDVLDNLFDHGDDDHEGSSDALTTINPPQAIEALKFFVSTKTKTLKTTVTSTQYLTSYHTCYKGN